MTEVTTYEHIVLNGRLLPRDQAQISVFNQAFFSSFGVYESIQVQRGMPFHLDDHLHRLFDSAKVIELPLDHDFETVRGWVDMLLRADAISEALLRILVFGANGNEETLIYILPLPLPRYPAAFYTSGTRAITFEGTRALPQAKTLNTLVNYLALRRARSLGVHEAILVSPEGSLTEGSRSNLFAVIKGKLVTPPAEQVLSGITRDLVWKLASSAGIALSEGPIYRARLDEVDEMFVTSTSMHILPVVELDGHPIGDGLVGPVTRTLMQGFEDYYAEAMSRAEALRLSGR